MSEINRNELFRACDRGDRATVERLLPSTSPRTLNTVGPDGNTPLHVASSNGHSEIVKLLLEYGASRRIRNSQNRTPLELAKTSDTVEMFDRSKEEKFNRYPVYEPNGMEWLLNRQHALSIVRAVKLGNIRDRGIAKAVEKIKKARIVPVNESNESRLFMYYLNEALEKNDPNFLVKAYTMEGPFYSGFNRTMAMCSKNKIYKKLCHKWTGYYSGVIMKNPILQRNRFCGRTYRGIMLPLSDIAQYQVGKPLANKAFQSTSQSYEVAFQFAKVDQRVIGMKSLITVFDIRDPTTAIDISSISEYPEEREVLMFPGTCFQVMDVKDDELLCEVLLEQLVVGDDCI